MKKLYSLLVLVLLISVAAKSQPVIGNVIPPVGTRFDMKQVSGSTTHLSRGANQTWNVTLTGSTLLTYEWVALSAVPQAVKDTFAGATHALSGNMGSMNILYDMYRDDSNHFVVMGQKGSGSSWQKHSRRVEFKHPMALLDTFGTYGGSSMATYDSYGTMNLNGTAYTDVIRFRIETPGNGDSLFMYASIAPHYQKLLHYVVSSSGTVGNVFYYVPVSSTSVSELKESKFDLYPNPVKDVLSIHIGELKETILTLSTIEGKVVKTIKIESLETHVPVENLPAGAYIATLDTGITRSSKLFVKD